MRARRVLAIVAAFWVVIVVFVAGVAVGGHAKDVGLIRLSDPLRSLLLGDSGQDLSAQVLEVLRDDYYEKVDTTGLEQASVEAIVEKLGDPYTDYLDPDELQALRDRNEGAYFGVGLQVAQRGDAIVVTRVFDGSPAAEEGVKALDRVVSVNGTPATGRPLEAVVADIRGKEGTAVTLGIQTGDAPPRSLKLTRARIQVPAVDSRIITVDGHEVGYVRLAQFTRGASEALREAVTDLRDKGAQALVLDLRGDPGGLVSEAVGVTGVFLESGSTVVVTQGLHSPKHVYTTDATPVAGDLPLMVLVDRNSASASEIVAGALRDSKRGTLVGERTFGKALVQSTVLLRDGGALKLTTARYLTPAGYDLAKRGLPPTVKVVDDPGTAPDEALQKGLALAAAAG